MNELKPISRDAIPRALEKAERYRMLNEPFFAESICLDVLACDPEHPRALAIYVLCLTDQFSLGSVGTVPKALAAIELLKSEFERLYYAGIVSERRAVALLEKSPAGASDAAWHHLQDAMALYEKADAAQLDPTNDDALLRYNTCLRLIAHHRLIEPALGRQDYPLE
jgi:hypothetical protein